MTEIYSHPTLREKSHEELLFRLDQIRNRRLVTAIEVKIAHEAKMEKIASKLSEQWEKQDERNRLDMLKVDELITKIEKGIAKQVELAHRISLAEIK